jgi:uncharacterized membrane protein (DUF4010 family)
MAMAQRARTTREQTAAAIASAAASTVATYVEIAILVGAVSPALLVRLVPALGAAGIVAAAVTIVFAARAAREAGVAPHDVDRPVNVRGALLFAVVVTAISILASALDHWLGDSGLLLGASIAALADSHAASVSVATVFTAGHFGAEVAAAGVLVCLSSNALTKVVLAFAGKAPRNFSIAVTAQVTAATAASWIAFGLVR